MAIIASVENTEIGTHNTRESNLFVTTILDNDLNEFQVSLTIHKTTVYLTAAQRDHLVYELNNIKL